MNKKMIIVLFIAIGLVMGSTFLSQKAYATDGPNMCWAPYCIKTGPWWTGLHITTYYFTETLTIYVWHEDTIYETVTLNITHGTWTGVVENLLTTPANFQSPSLLYVISLNGPFAVTQFMGNTGSVGGGFGFQTLQSWPSVSPWWPNKAPLSEPLSEPQGAEENLRTRLPAE